MPVWTSPYVTASCEFRPATTTTTRTSNVCWMRWRATRPDRSRYPGTEPKDFVQSPGIEGLGQALKGPGAVNIAFDCVQSCAKLGAIERERPLVFHRSADGDHGGRRAAFAAHGLAAPRGFQRSGAARRR